MSEAQFRLLSWSTARFALFSWIPVSLLSLVGGAATSEPFVGVVWAIFLLPLIPVAVFGRWAEDQPVGDIVYCALGAAVIACLATVLVVGQLMYLDAYWNGRALDGATVRAVAWVTNPIVWVSAAVFSVPAGSATYLRLRVHHADFRWDLGVGRTVFVVFLLGLGGAVAWGGDEETIVFAAISFVVFVAIATTLLLGAYALADHLNAKWSPDA